MNLFADEQSGFLARVDAPDFIHTLVPALSRSLLLQDKPIHHFVSQWMGGPFTPSISSISTFSPSEDCDDSLHLPLLGAIQATACSRPGISRRMPLKFGTLGLPQPFIHSLYGLKIHLLCLCFLISKTGIIVLFPLDMKKNSLHWGWWNSGTGFPERW